MAAGVTVAEPEAPDAEKPAPVQDVALVELQVSFEDCPAATEVGLAASVAVGAGDPDPEPEQEAWLVCVEYGETTTQE